MKTCPCCKQEIKETRLYLVHWTIDIEATSPREAALKALKIQRDPDSLATCFEVSRYPGKLDGSDVETIDLGGDCPVDPNVVMGVMGVGE